MRYRDPFIVNSLYNWIKDILKRHGIKSYSFEAKLILSRAVNKDRAMLALIEDEDFYSSRYNLTSITFNAIDMALRRSRGIPLEYIISEKHFYISKYYVNPSCFIPRYDTEVLLEFLSYYFSSNILKKKNRKIKILDFGMGSGNINTSLLLIILEKYFILEARNLSFSIFGVESSKKAFQIASKNLFLSLHEFYKSNGQKFPLNEFEVNNIDFKKKSFLIEIFYLQLKKLFCKKIKTKFNIIVSNPPYLKKKDLYENKLLKYEPLEALLYKKDPLYYYKKLMIFAQTNMKKQGILIFETSLKIKKDVLDISKNYKSLRYIKSLKDSTKKQRALVFKKTI